MINAGILRFRASGLGRTAPAGNAYVGGMRASCEVHR